MLLLKRKRTWAVALIPICLVLASVASSHPQIVERLYSRAFYPVLAGIFGRVFSLFPFSVAELLILLLAVGILIGVVFLLRALKKCTARQRVELGQKVLSNILCAAGIIYALFTVLCGLGYYRLSFAEQSGLPIRPSSPQELAELSRMLVLEANTLRGEVAQSPETATMRLSFTSAYKAAAFAGEAYANLAEEYPALGGFTPRAKPVFFSRIMSYTEICGIYVPFTFEANVNVDIPDYNIPSTMMHELSHYHGFMREEEANFLAYLACRKSGNADFMYSGTMLALIHTTNALYDADRNAYWEIIGLLSSEVRADLAENDAYWKRFEGLVADVAVKVNDVYLRTNRQSSGVKSYGEMVDLLLADYRANHKSNELEFREKTK